jgi:hypothetical protein
LSGPRWRRSLPSQSRRPSMTAAGRCRRCDDRREVLTRWGNVSVTASTAGLQSVSAAGCTAAGACAACGSRRRRRHAPAAARIGCWTRQAVDACCACDAARGAVARSVIAGHWSVGPASGATSGKRRRHHALAAANPASCASRPTGAVPVRGRGQPNNRLESAANAANCASMPGSGCARHAGSVTQIGRSSARTISSPGCRSHRPGWVSSPPMWPPGSAPAERPR